MTWSPARVALLVGLCAAITTSGVRGGADPIAAEALWRWAMVESDGELTHPAFVDATEALARLRPWHPGYAEARARIRIVGTARAAAHRR